MQQVWFAPARPSQPEGPLARYRPPELAGAAQEFVARLTAPGDLVLDFFCQGPAFVREAVRAGRRVVGTSVNPLNLLVARLNLEPPPDPSALNAAFTRLADSPKGDFPLRRHLAGLYRTHCPECAAEATAVWFAWDREAYYPYAKAVRCLRCGEVKEGPTDEADIAAARRLEPKGLVYHYALNRVAPMGHPARERAAELVGLYTSRNLSALMDVAMRLEGMDLERRVRLALQGVLLDAFDRGCSLDPHGEARARPRTLRLPARFLERNVWLFLEEEVTRLAERPPVEKPLLQRAPGLSALLSDRSPGYVLTPSAAREVGRLLPPRATSLILVDPPRPDGVFWALCALWAGWLWDLPAAHALRPFLRRRRFDWEWHQAVLEVALAAVAPLLEPGGHLVTLFDEPDVGLLESVCLAASGAGYDLLGWGCDPEVGCHLVWQRAGRRPEPAAEEEQPRELSLLAADLALRCLEQRGEPTPRAILHAAVCAGLARRGDCGGESYGPAIRQGLGRLAVEKVAEGPELLWLPNLEGRGVEPLADRVEEKVWEAFQARSVWTEEEFLRHVYDHFDGPLTPDLSLVLACLDSYGRWREGEWWLREEDAPGRRAKEVQVLRKDLVALGKRLGFRVRRGRGWDVRWQEGGQDIYLFALSPTAALGRYLLADPSVPEGAIPCLVFPGGRAELLAHKLQRDPRLARVAGEKRWQFIKFRHLRRLIAEGLDRRSFETVLGLDPVTGREGVQIPLVLGGEM